MVTPPQLPRANSATLLSSRPLTSLTGVGPGIEKKLHELGIQSIQDLLFHFPLRYQDRTRIHPIASIRLGENVLVQGELLSNQVEFGRRRSLHCVLSDGSGVISLRFFHFSAAQKANLRPGVLLRCYGEVRRGKAGLEVYHPEYQLFNEGDAAPLEDSYTPIYPSSDGLHQKRLRSIISQALAILDRASDLEDYLPQEIIAKHRLHSLIDAIRLLHNPPADTPRSWLSNGAHPALKRLAFEELLAHRLCLRRMRAEVDVNTAPRIGDDTTLKEQFLNSLAFQLTQAQQRAVADLLDDLRSPGPMLRLLQGDVGSGKTVVAAITALQVVSSGYQVAVMAPTEILAEQHFATFSQWLAPLDVQIGWLSGKIKGSKRKAQLSALVDGGTSIIIGTHALFQSDVQFHNLGLVIVDEQHRFGVHQRMALRDKGGDRNQVPHQLVMTATPIPRTLAMSAYADLDCSIIDELPPGRKPINTVVIDGSRRGEVIERIRNACAGNDQVYWVCTLIEESEALQCQAAEATFEQLSIQLPELDLALIHGRLKPLEKAEIMDRFKKGDTQLLVATTVIEVGVDVPNASLMVIENSERLGLAQLHQLRGRVGRGSKSSHCILLYQSPLSATGKKRLSVLRESNDGFYIAEQDLEIRGPGQMLGTQQTGLMSFRVADILRDAHLLEQVEEASNLVLGSYPTLTDSLIDRWIADKQHYAQV